jgi:hypothetical protein
VLFIVRDRWSTFNLTGDRGETYYFISNVALGELVNLMQNRTFSPVITSAMISLHSISTNRCGS